MKFSQIARGKRAERRTSFPYPGPDGLVEVEVLCVPLGVAEEAEVCAFAVDYARRKGVKEPREGDPLHAIGAQIKTVELSFLDPDSPPDARTRLFASTDEIETRLERETLTYLYAVADDWQDQCSPSVRKMPEDKFAEAVQRLGSGGPDAERFFDSLSPALRRIFTLSMARQLAASLGDKSGPSGSITSGGTSAPSKSPPSTPPTATPSADAARAT